MTLLFGKKNFNETSLQRHNLQGPTRPIKEKFGENTRNCVNHRRVKKRRGGGPIRGEEKNLYVPLIPRTYVHRGTVTVGRDTLGENRGENKIQMRGTIV